jgi:hypothetical protein
MMALELLDTKRARVNQPSLAPPKRGRLAPSELLDLSPLLIFHAGTPYGLPI